jgi:hypothetical protein
MVGKSSRFGVVDFGSEVMSGMVMEAPAAL